MWHVPKAVFQLLFWGEKDYEVSVIRLRTHGDAELLDGRSARVLLSVQLCFTDVSVDLRLFQSGKEDVSSHLTLKRPFSVPVVC